MNHLKRRSLCKSCRVCFIRDNDTQVYCHSCLSESLCKSKKLIKEGDENRKKCFICLRWFLPINGRSTCGEQCKKSLILENKNTISKNKREKEGDLEGLAWEGERRLRVKWSSSFFMDGECEVVK